MHKKIYKYLFIVKKITDDKECQACSAIACFAYSKDFEEIVAKIKSLNSK